MSWNYFRNLKALKKKGKVLIPHHIGGERAILDELSHFNSNKVAKGGKYNFKLENLIEIGRSWRTSELRLKSN